MMRALAPSSFLASIAMLAACDGQVLSFDANAIDWGSDRAAGGKSVSSLTDDEANELCRWVEDHHPDHGDPYDPSHFPPPAPGYVAGPPFGFACPQLDPNVVIWVLLSPDDCSKNLRHAACAATADDVERCVDAVTAIGKNGQGPDCPRLATACAAIIDTPGCQETVFKHPAGAWDGGIGDHACAGALPVVAGAGCPAP